MKKIITTTMTLFITALITISINACDNEETLALPEEADFFITSKTLGIKSYGSPFVTITVRNIGSATGYNVSCDVQAKVGNTIIDAGFAFFANGGNIISGESALDDAIFFKLESHSDYDSLEFELSWLTR